MFLTKCQKYNKILKIMFRKKITKRINWKAPPPPTNKPFLTVLTRKHIGIIDVMLVSPNLNHTQIAKMAGVSRTTISHLVNSALFQEEYDRRREKHEREMSRVLAHKIVSATVDAVEKSREIINGEEIPIPIIQASIRDILDQGHAKAIERKASVSAVVPLELLAGLRSIAEEVAIPFESKRLLKPKEVTDTGA